jgi:NAD(P)-dependent dehydrogenase (short-subunit alcohol dehydrogenase family)
MAARRRPSVDFPDPEVPAIRTRIGVSRRRRGESSCVRYKSEDMGEGSEGVRVAVVSGVSRRTGIGFAIAQRLLAEGRNVLIHSWSAHDTENAGTDDGAMTRVIVDLDLAWAVNARASVLLVQAYAKHRDDTRAHGRVLLFTSGQHLRPKPDELPYAISKGAVHQMTRSLADALARRSITVNRATRCAILLRWPLSSRSQNSPARGAHFGDGNSPISSPCAQPAEILTSVASPRSRAHLIR